MIMARSEVTRYRLQDAG